MASERTAIAPRSLRLRPRPIRHAALGDLVLMPSYRYPVVMAEKKKVTLYVDAEVMRAARVRAARTDRRDSEIVEEALRAYLGFDVLASVWGRSDLDEDQAMALAVDAVHESRAERRAARSS